MTSKSHLKFAAAALALLASSPLGLALALALALAEDAAAAGTEAPAAADAKTKGDADTKAAMQGEMERQLYVGMVALKDFCKQSEPDKAAEFDASWEKNTADVPAELKTYSATPEFQGKVAARVKQLGDSSKTTAGGAEIKGACAKIIATK